MGSVDIAVVKIGVYNNANEAYREAQEEADEEYGHQQGYSGEINSTDSITRSCGHPRYGSNIFYRWLATVMADMNKGDLIYIELTKSQLKRYQSSYLKGKRGVKGYIFFGWARS
jgi:hypothetical protein|tara:strand:+ start:261 stop:602 length:342 start_codon:yes stop_codon:yes gene_type:complete